MASIQTSIQLNDQMTGVLSHITNALNMTISTFEEMNNASENAIDPENFQNIRAEIERASSQFDDMRNHIEDNSDAQNDFNRSVDNGGSSIDSLTKKLLGMAAAYISIQGLMNTIREAVDYASDLVEVQNVVDVTFEESADIINEWAKTTTAAFGISELTAKQYASTMGAMLKSSGMTGDAVNGLSINLAQLSADMASFYNLDTDAAFDKIRSGISGETEPLKQLGINMSVTNLEAYALSQGIDTAYDSMTQAQQTLLRYNYLMQATADAQNDFSRTQDSYANQLRKLKQSWQAFTGTLATNVIPILSNVISSLNGLIASFDVMSQAVSNHWSIIAPIMGAIVTLIGLYTSVLLAHLGAVAANAVAEGIANVVAYARATALLANVNATLLATSAEYALAVATAQATVAQAGFNTALLASPITWIVILIVAVIAAVIAWANSTQNAGITISSVFSNICGGINVVIQFFKNLGLQVANIAVGIWNSLQALCSNIPIAFGNAINGAKAWFYDLLSTAVTVIGQIAAELNKLPFVEFDYSGITSAADNFAARAAEANSNKQAYNSISDAFDKGMNTFDTFSDGWISDAFNAGKDWGTKTADKVSGAYADLSNIDFDSLGGNADAIAENSGNTAGNTASIADSLNTTNEQLKYLHDIAERDTINRFTTAEIKINQTNNNNVANGVDVDGMITTLNEGLREAIGVTVEGVVVA